MSTNTASLAENDVSEIIIALEKVALEKWNQGDPSGYLELSTEDVTYFDPFLEKRLNGRSELSRLYEQIWGMVKVDRYELINPRVQGGEQWLF